MNELLTAIGHLLEAASRGMRPYLPQIALAISSTVLAIYGGGINKAVKDSVNGYPFALRLLVFVLLVTFGYGAVTLLVSHLLALLIGKFSNLLLMPVTAGIFLVLGYLAEEKNQI